LRWFMWAGHGEYLSKTLFYLTRNLNPSHGLNQ
jgi:hypothetical protein